MAQMARTSFTLDPQVVADLRYCAQRMGVSGSAIVSDFLSVPLADMRRMLEAIPPNPTDADLVRFRGESRQIVEQRLENLKGLGDGLFDDRAEDRSK